LRAGAEDRATLDGRDAKKRPELIAQQLQRCASIRNA
jgi:hypothetical protein